MYNQVFEVVLLTPDGWRAFTDVDGRKVNAPTPSFAKAIAEELKTQEGVLDAMALKVEEFQVYHPVTRQMWTHKHFTGLTNG